VRWLLLPLMGAMLLGLAGCGQRPHLDFGFIFGSENTVIEPIVQEFCKSHNLCKFDYAGSLDTGLALQSPAGVKQDAAWPASSVWVDTFDAGRKVSHLTSIAQMPVILGVRKSKAGVDKPVYMKDILAAVKAGS